MRSLSRCHVAKCMAFSFTLLLAPSVGLAVPFSPDISILASVELDATSLEPSGGTQTGTLSLTSGGVSATSSINGITVTGSHPLSGMLTDIGDSVGMNFLVSGTEIETEFYGNYNMSLANNSATDSYLVTLGFTSTNLVQVMGELDNDVYAESQVYLASSLEELFYTYRYVDLLFYEDFDDTCNGCLFTYDLLLGVGDSIDLFGQHDIFAAAYDFGTGYEIALAATISVLGVENLSAQVPEPPISLMFATGVALLLAVTKTSHGERPTANA